MKAYLAMAVAGAVVLSTSAHELKIATVDLQRLLSEYHRAQEVGKQLKEKHVSFQKELEGLRLEGRKLITETEELQKRSVDHALSGPERATRSKAFEAKVIDLRAFEIRYDNARTQREAELQAFATENNKRVIADVLSITRAIGDKEGLNLILNSSRSNPISSDVLYVKGVPDITDKVLASLNSAAEPAKAKPSAP